MQVVIEREESPPMYMFHEIVTNYQCRLRYLNMPKCACRAITEVMKACVREVPRDTPWFHYTFVRHPLTRFMSGYTEKVLTNKMGKLLPGCGVTKDIGLDGFIEWLLGFRHPDKIEQHFRPQSMTIDCAQMEMQFVGKLENMHEDWRVLMEKGLPAINYYKNHRSNAPTWQETLNTDQETKLRRLYAPDIERWPEYDKPV